MYNFKIVAVGRVKGPSTYLNEGIDEFLKRLRPFCRVSFTEVPEETVTSTVTEEQVQSREATRLLANVKPGDLLIALSERGELLSSEAFSHRLFGGSANTSNPPNGGAAAMAEKPIIVVVGGPSGLSPQVIERADWVLSLSPMTFPHQMVRLVFLEQLYRALKIFRKEPYHK